MDKRFINKKFFALTGFWIVLFAGIQGGCGGGSQFAEEIEESPESGMDSVYESSTADDLFDSDSDFMDDESSLEALDEDEDFDLIADSGSDSDLLSEEPLDGLDARSIGEEPEAGGEVLMATEGDLGASSDLDGLSLDFEGDESSGFVSPSAHGDLGALSEDGVQSYIVERGDSLWRISEKPSIYSDPWEWPLIYHANENKISNPDLIHIGWDLDIPRGVEENVILAAIQEARSASYVAPSRAAQTEDLGTLEELAAELTEESVLLADADQAKKIITQAPQSEKAAPIQARGGGGGLKLLLWFLIIASLVGAGYLYWKKMRDRKGLNAGAATFSF